MASSPLAVSGRAFKARASHSMPLFAGLLATAEAAPEGQKRISLSGTGQRSGPAQHWL